MMIIYGPAASGKTRYAEAFRKHFHCTRVRDEWRPGIGAPLEEGDLALTEFAPWEPPQGVIVMSIYNAIRLIGGHNA